MKKGLTKQDQEIWERVTKTVHRTKRVSKKIVTSAEQVKVATKPLPEPQMNKKSIGSKVASDFKLSKSSTQLDRRNHARLVKGKFNIDASIDLHGMTLAQAQTQFLAFVQYHYQIGSRLLLVVTGKGRHIMHDEFDRPRSGVLKQALPDWVENHAVNRFILKTTPAQQRHGGAGAFYVYLRRKRDS